MTTTPIGTFTDSAPPAWTRADRFRKSRVSAGFTQQDLADRIGCSRKTVINYEADLTTPLPVYLTAWARHTGVSVAWIETGASA